MTTVASPGSQTQSDHTSGSTPVQVHPQETASMQFRASSQVEKEEDPSPRFESLSLKARPPPGRPQNNWRRGRFLLYGQPLDQDDVLITGELQQKGRFFGWYQRFGVLKADELQVYKDEESWHRSSESPLEVLKLRELRAVQDPGFCRERTFTFRCVWSSTGVLHTTFRAGSGVGLWEDVASMKLWVAMINRTHQSLVRSQMLKAGVSSNSQSTIDLQMGG